MKTSAKYFDPAVGP